MSQIVLYGPVKSVDDYLYGCPAKDGINEHIFFTVTFHLQQPTRVALNKIQKWAWFGVIESGSIVNGRY